MKKNKKKKSNGQQGFRRRDINKPGKLRHQRVFVRVMLFLFALRSLPRLQCATEREGKGADASTWHSRVPNDGSISFGGGGRGGAYFERESACFINVFRVVFER